MEVSIYQRLTSLTGGSPREDQKKLPAYPRQKEVISTLPFLEFSQAPCWKMPRGLWLCQFGLRKPGSRSPACGMSKAGFTQDPRKS